MSRASLERSVVLAATAALVIFRGIAFVAYGHIHFNSDQAIVGLMAKHLSELRALPIYFYGQHYMLGVEAWVAALVFPFTGATVGALGAVMLGFNLAVALLLVHLLHRDAGLRPLHAFVAALFFLIPMPGTTMELMNANGGNIEPFLYVLLLWLFRRKPVLFGVTLAVGLLNREFTIYGLGALIVIEVFNGSLFRRSSVAPLLVGAVAFVAVLQSIAVLDAFASVGGPATIASDIVRRPGNEDVASRICWNPSVLPQAFGRLLTAHLGQLFGGTVQPVSRLGIRSDVTQGVVGLWPLLGATLVATLAAVLYWCLRERRRAWKAELQFGSYLLLTGAICAVVRVLARCGELEIMRYTLLAILAPIGVVALFFSVEPSAFRRRTVMAVIALWAAVSIVGHVKILKEQIDGKQPDYFGQLVDVLASKGIRYAKADYWTAYYLTFRAQEQIVVDSTDFIRIWLYRGVVNAHAEEAIRIQRQPCPNGVELVAGAFYSCPF